MSGVPGYYKWAHGRNFRVPKDYCVCRNENGMPYKVKRVVRVIEAPSSGSLSTRDFTDRKGTIIGAFVEKCSCKKPFRVKHRKGKFRVRKFGGVFSRYREKNPEHELFGKVPAGTVLGTYEEFFVSSGSKILSKTLKTTGDTAGSLVFEKCWDQVNPGPPYNWVGPLYHIKSVVPTALAHPCSFETIDGGIRKVWKGKFMDDGWWFDDSITNYQHVGAPVLPTGYDSLAWDKLKPKVEKANVAQFIYELRDLPRMLETSADLFHRLYRGFDDPLPSGIGSLQAAMSPHSVADNFLNHSFGWAPFLGDLAKMFNVWQESFNLIAQLVQENNKWVHKKAILDETNTTRLIGRVYNPSIMNFGDDIQRMCKTKVVDGISCKGICDVWEIEESRVWATGEFKFYRPEFDMDHPDNNSYISAIQRLMTLYGVRITPTLIYKVTPWTWLIDWFTSFGKFINRVDDFIVDGIIAQNLCIMRRTERKVVKQSTIFGPNGDIVLKWERFRTIKARKIADSPYGFDQPWNTLTPRQLAILAAVGLTQSSSGFISRGA